MNYRQRRAKTTAVIEQVFKKLNGLPPTSKFVDHAERMIKDALNELFVDGTLVFVPRFSVENLPNNDFYLHFNETDIVTCFGDPYEYEQDK